MCIPHNVLRTPQLGCVSVAAAVLPHLQEDASSSGYHMKYVSHVFSGGADCLLTGSPRTAEVSWCT
jgi:hypothetical protein